MRKDILAYFRRNQWDYPIVSLPRTFGACLIVTKEDRTKVRFYPYLAESVGLLTIKDLFTALKVEEEHMYPGGKTVTTKMDMQTVPDVNRLLRLAMMPAPGRRTKHYCLECGAGYVLTEILKNQIPVKDEILDFLQECVKDSGYKHELRKINRMYMDDYRKNVRKHDFRGVLSMP